MTTHDSNVNASWKHPWSMDEIINSSQCWSLAADYGVCELMKQFSTDFLNEISNLNGNVMELCIESKQTNVKIQNAFNDFCLLANDHFMENLVEQVGTELTTKSNELNKENADTQKKEDKLMQLNIQVSEAIKLGMEVLENQFEILDVQRMQRDSCVNADDSEIDAQSTGTEALTPITPTVDYANAELIYHPKDPYEHRHLPHLIGTVDFVSDDTLGIGYLDDKEDDDEEEDEDEEIHHKGEGVLFSCQDELSSSFSDNSSLDSIGPIKSKKEKQYKSSNDSINLFSEEDENKSEGDLFDIALTESKGKKENERANEDSSLNLPRKPITLQDQLHDQLKKRLGIEEVGKEEKSSSVLLSSDEFEELESKSEDKENAEKSHRPQHKMRQTTIPVAKFQSIVPTQFDAQSSEDDDEGDIFANFEKINREEEKNQKTKTINKKTTSDQKLVASPLGSNDQKRPSERQTTSIRTENVLAAAEKTEGFLDDEEDSGEDIFSFLSSPKPVKQNKAPTSKNINTTSATVVRSQTISNPTSGPVENKVAKSSNLFDSDDDSDIDIFNLKPTSNEGKNKSVVIKSKTEPTKKVEDYQKKELTNRSIKPLSSFLDDEDDDDDINDIFGNFKWKMDKSISTGSKVTSSSILKEAEVENENIDKDLGNDNKKMEKETSKEKEIRVSRERDQKDTITGVDETGPTTVNRNDVFSSPLSRFDEPPLVVTPVTTLPNISTMKNKSDDEDSLFGGEGFDMTTKISTTKSNDNSMVKSGVGTTVKNQDDKITFKTSIPAPSQMMKNFIDPLQSWEPSNVVSPTEAESPHTANLMGADIDNRMVTKSVVQSIDSTIDDKIAVPKNDDQPMGPQSSRVSGRKLPAGAVKLFGNPDIFEEMEKRKRKSREPSMNSDFTETNTTPTMPDRSEKCNDEIISNSKIMQNEKSVEEIKKSTFFAFDPRPPQIHSTSNHIRDHEGEDFERKVIDFDEPAQHATGPPLTALTKSRAKNISGRRKPTIGQKISSTASNQSMINSETAQPDAFSSANMNEDEYNKTKEQQVKVEDADIKVNLPVVKPIEDPSDIFVNLPSRPEKKVSELNKKAKVNKAKKVVNIDEIEDIFAIPDTKKTKKTKSTKPKPNNSKVFKEDPFGVI